MTKIAEMCERDVVVASREMSVADAAKLMRSRHVGCVVVVDAVSGGLGVPRGIVTDRDIVMGVVATDLDPKVITVVDIMPRELVVVLADQDPLEAIRLMRARGVRRLPVVTQNGHLIGLVAFDDMLEVVGEGLSDLTGAVGREQAHEASTRR